MKHKERTAMGFAVYRPDGTVQSAFPQSMRLSADQRASLIAWAFHYDSKDPERGCSVCMPADEIAAKKAGYRVGRVEIKPSR